MHLTNNMIQIKRIGIIDHFLILLKKSGQLKIQYVAVFILTAAVLYGCGPLRPDDPVIPLPKNAYEIYGKVYHPMDDANGFRQQGVASWYGEKFHEKKTANGETYNMYAMTAAHKTLPFGTMVEVKNIENSKTTIVRVNDRGPFCRDRIIDLSFTAAKEIEMINNGTAAVEIVALGNDDEILTESGNTMPDNVYFTGDFTIQVGSFGDPDNAEKLKISLEKIAQNVHVVAFEKNGLTFYRVRVGRFTSLKQAQRIEQHLVQNGFKNVYTVAWDL
ncbi:MAG: septal ring lytic transglycosylase RlpA family protein [Desulfobacteraceae bacterium]|nr:septal ring lytic transglycosylase RlpA family protein [Desulfobacteraceae bacterium]MBC2755328.1 septal ring lytic transglycosylase RlpA family protein [Desulfobacteraceae bacterium]